MGGSLVMSASPTSAGTGCGAGERADPPAPGPAGGDCGQVHEGPLRQLPQRVPDAQHPPAHPLWPPGTAGGRAWAQTQTPPWAPLSAAPLSQGLLTFGYLVLLSRIGERMAVDMRRALFSNLLRYCPLQGAGVGRARGPRAPGECLEMGPRSEATSPSLPSAAPMSHRQTRHCFL